MKIKIKDIVRSIHTYPMDGFECNLESYGIDDEIVRRVALKIKLDETKHKYNCIVAGEVIGEDYPHLVVFYGDKDHIPSEFTL